MSRRRTVRITPLGYIVLSIIILVMLVGIYFIVWSMSGKSGEQPQGNLNSASVQLTPTPPLVPTNAPTQAPTAAPTAQPSSTPQPTAAMTPKADDTPEPAMKTPSASQVSAAVDGTLNASGVALRGGPAKTYALLGT